MYIGKILASGCSPSAVLAAAALRRAAPWIVAALGVIAPAAAQGAATQIGADAAVTRACHERLAGAGAAGVDRMRYTASATGLVRARLRARGGDWDVGVFDARTRRSVAGSAAFASNELAEGFVRKGQRLVVQGCRVRGAVASARLSVQVLAVGGAEATSARTGARAAAAGDRVQVVEVATATRGQKRRLQSLDLDLTEHGTERSLEVVLHGADDAARLRGAGFTWKVKIADLGARLQANAAADARYAAATAESGLPSGATSYRRLPDYEYELKQLAMQYPSLVRPITLNHRSWEGRDVSAIEITRNPAAADGKPVFLMMGVHHAREWPSSEHTIEFAYDLVRNYGAAERTTRLVDATRTIVVPVINPDGFNVSREARTGPAARDFSQLDFEMKRKNCRDAVGSCDRRTRLSGVDPNRNYGGLWGGSGASPSTLSDVYRGPGPFSEPEVRNVRELIAARQVVTLITNHTYSNLVLRVPGTIDQGFPLEEPQYKALGAAMTAHNGYSNIPGFGLYDTTGTTEDWSFWSTGGLGFTFEIGPEEFHPPYETGVVAEYLGHPPAAGAGRGGNREAYYEILSATADAALHSVLTGSAPAGSTLTLRKTFQTATSPVCRDTFCTDIGERQFFEDTLRSSMTTSGPSFAWHVNPSTRPEVAGRFGRDAAAAPQATIPLANPAGFPDENVYYPFAGPSLANPYESIPFEVQGPPAVDNGRFTVHIEWANANNDWDVYVLDPSGAIVTQSAAFGDTTEDATLLDPPPGTYTAIIVNYDQVSRTPDDWSGEVRFQSPTPTTIGTKEAWTFTCRTPAGVTATREVIVDRGARVDLGRACG